MDQGDDIQSFEKLHIDPSPKGSCDAHGWPADGLPQQIVTEMKKRHLTGGLNVCRACIERARKVAGDQKFPLGRLNSQDEGELKIRIAADPKKRVVMVAFGKPVGWLALPADHARSLALGIEKKANELDPPIAQGTGIMVRAEVDGVEENVEVETLSEAEMRGLFATMGADQLRLWLVTVLRMIHDARLLRER